MNRRHFGKLITTGLAGAAASCSKQPTTNASGKPIVRLGHFPNITHVQALVAHQLSRQGKGWFESRLDAEIQWFLYNAGPSATEAIFAKALDATYIGPSPVLNGYAKSKGADLRILAGAANGGSSLVVRPDAGIKTVADFRGKKVATPQLGNTQDVQLRAYLAENGFTITQTGGDVHVLPTQNADQLQLFMQKQLDAVWTAEPWVSRLELEAGGQIFLEDRDTNITLLAASAAFVTQRPELAQKLTAAHCELTDWIKANPVEARALIKAELTELLHDEPKDAMLDKALPRITLTNEISRPSLEKMVSSAQKVGFLKEIPSLDQLLPKP